MQLRDVVPARPLIYAEYKSRVQDVLDLLRNHRILSVPVTDEGCKRFVGMIDVFELVQFTARSFFDSEDYATQDDNPLNFEEIFRQLEFEEKTAGDLVKESVRAQSLKIFKPEATLGEAARVLSSSDQRILVGDQPDTAYLISQTDVVRFLHKNKTLVPKELLETGLYKLPNVNVMKDVKSITESSAAMQGFFEMARQGIMAVAVVDEQNKLVGSLSASDLRGLSEQTLSALTRPALEFIRATSGRDPMPPVRCLPTDTLEYAMDLVLKAKVHRVWVTDEGHHPVGVLAMTDITRCLLTS